MASSISAGNATNGVIVSSDNTGALNLITGSGSGTTAVAIDSSQNVGVGTTTPATKLQVNGTANGSVATLIGNASLTGSAPTNTGSIRLIDNPTASTAAGGFEFLTSTFGSGYGWKIASIDSSGVQLTFSTRQNSASWTESMRIDPSGNLLVGNTGAATATLTINSTAAQNSALFYSSGAGSSTACLRVAKQTNDSTTAQVYIQFLINNQINGGGQINANGASAAAFGAFSDRRLKENITDLPSQLANIMALRPVEFDYIESEGGGHQIGFVAQEVQEIYPDLIGEREDGMLTLTDMNKNDARLIKAIQEQQAMILELKAELDALKAKVGE